MRAVRTAVFRLSGRERRRPGWIKSAQKFAAHPWQQSLIVGGFGGLVLAAILAQISRDAVWPYALGAGAAIAGPFLYRYWFGPHICRKYLEQPPPA